MLFLQSVDTHDQLEPSLAQAVDLNLPKEMVEGVEQFKVG